MKFLYTGDFDENIWMTPAANSSSISTTDSTPLSSSNGDRSASSIAALKFDKIGKILAFQIFSFGPYSIKADAW